METLKAIRTRSSIIKYRSRTVSEKAVREILSAGMSAPSAGNEEPRHFFVITDRTLMDRVADIHPRTSIVREAPVAVIVCADLIRDKFNGFWIQDCAAATQNILLASHAKGLAALWIGIYPDEGFVEKTQKLLGLPVDTLPVSLVPIGYPAQKLRSLKRYREDRVHFNKW
ncbi:MAG: nitroreductase family protein [Nitrospirae bacterium]|nr:nitroreductase family protein [Nitrospirota bacterium]